MSEPIEPRSPELSRLLQALPPPVPPTPTQLSSLWARVETSAQLVVPATAAAISGKTVAIAVAAALAGGAGGVALDRTWFAPEPRVEVRVERIEVPVPQVVAPPPLVPEPAPTTRASVPKPTSPPVPKPIGGLTAEERQLIETARTALIKRDTTEALQALDRHRARFSNGALAEERDHLEIQALLQAGRADDARRAARAFNAKYPQSVFPLPAIE